MKSISQHLLLHKTAKIQIIKLNRNNMIKDSRKIKQKRTVTLEFTLKSDSVCLDNFVDDIMPTLMTILGQRDLPDGLDMDVTIE